MLHFVCDREPPNLARFQLLTSCTRSIAQQIMCGLEKEVHTTSFVVRTTISRRAEERAVPFSLLIHELSYYGKYANPHQVRELPTFCVWWFLYAEL